MPLSAARTAAEQLLTALDRDGSAEALTRTFGAVAEAWIGKVAKLKNDSWKLQERRLEMHVYPRWKDRKILEIRRGDVRELIEGIEGDVLPNRVLAVVKTVFRYALSRDWIETSPAEGIAKPKDETERDRVLDMAEVRRVWDASALLGYPGGSYVRLLLLTAQRRSEVAGMRWDDLDLPESTWTLSAAVTKSDRAHLVPLSKEAVKLIEGLPELGDYVFTTDGKTSISGFAKLKTRLDSFLTATGDELPAWTFHDLRRTAATHMVRLGVLEEVVGRVLNHAPKGVTARVYALHSYQPEKRRALERWAAEVARAAAGSEQSGKVVSIHG
jgi:integrase